MKKYSGKTLNDAIAAACNDKHVLESELTYEIVEEKNGFLGIGREVIISAFCLADVVEFVNDYLVTFFKGLNREVSVTTKLEDGNIKVMLNSENNAILIGKGGETLRAMNIVTRNVTNSRFKHRYNIFIDINGYKEDRYEKVKSLALRVAKSVQRTRTDAVLDPMPNDERKVVHQALTGMKNIRTESEGEKNQRRLHIIFDPNKE